MKYNFTPSKKGVNKRFPLKRERKRKYVLLVLVKILDRAGIYLSPCHTCSFESLYVFLHLTMSTMGRFTMISLLHEQKLNSQLLIVCLGTK